MISFRRPGRRPSSRPRRMGSRRVVTRSGRVLRVNSSVGERWKARREAKAYRKVERLRGLPKSRLKRLAWRLSPRRQAEYWFSRDGGIMALKIIGVGIFIFFVMTIGVFAFFRKDLQNIKDLSTSEIGGSLAFYDRTNKIFLGQDYDKVKRIPVPGDQISQFIKDATVAVEDRDFYKHRGFDLRGIIRAAYNDLRAGGAKQGGSTITQQLVKLTREWGEKRTIARKIKEVILAVELERSYSKDEILSAYLNMAPYGGLDYGVQVAATDYFGRSAKDLNLAQSAMLAAIPQSPSIYSPYNKLSFDKQAFLNRYNYVLDSMVETGKITRAQADKAKKVNILKQVKPQRSKFAGVLAPYFLLAAENEIDTKFATEGAGGTKETGAWRVVTTLDMDVQKLAEQKVQANRANIGYAGANQSAVVVEDVPTGQIVALVGGVDFNSKTAGQINYAQWPISPGSSFKPYDYAALIENRDDAGAGAVLYDTVGPLPGYPCTNRTPRTGNCLHNFDLRSPGPITLRYALGGSRNIPAVKAMASVHPGDVQKSVNKTIETANRLMNNGAAYACYKDGADVTREQKADRTQCYTSAAIGDGAYLHLDQHTNGVASLGRMGLSIPSTYIMKIEGPGGDVIHEWSQPKKGDTGVDQVVRPETAFIINNMLSDPNASYFSGGGKFQRWNGWHIAVKTGTTNNAFDGLMMAYTTKYAVGSWVGHHTRQQEVRPPMENLTMPLTRDILQGALTLSKAQAKNWHEPSGIKHLPAYIIRSHVGYGSIEPSPATDIYPSWYQPRTASSRNATIDRVSGKIATDCTPPLARQTQAGSSTAEHFSMDIFYGAGGNRATGRPGATDDVHKCSDEKPSVSSFFINGQNAAGGGTIACASSCKITTTVSAGTHPFYSNQYPQFPGKVSLLVNGRAWQSKSVSSSPSTVSFNYTGNSATLSIEVIDSVLYATRSGGAKVSRGAPLSFTKAEVDGNKTKFEWSGGSGGFTVSRTDTGDVLCTTSSRDCEVDKSDAPAGTPVRVRDNSNAATATATVSN